MSSDNIAISVQNLSKCYQLYNQPKDRFKQSFLPRLQRLIGRSPYNYYSEFWALKNISFKVQKGESVGIIGRNGSGKSTLLQLVCGNLAQTYGSVLVNGKVASLLELGAGFNPEFTGRENVYMNGMLLGLTEEVIDQRFEEIAEFADIGKFMDQPVKFFSSGMYVRLAFSVSIHVDADILVIDEALSVGDAFFTQKCNIHMLNYMEGKTKLLVTHDMAAIANLTDRTIVLDNGNVVFDGGPLDAIEVYTRISRNNSFDKDDAPTDPSKGENRIIAKISRSNAFCGSMEFIPIEPEKLSGQMNARIDSFAVHADGAPCKDSVKPSSYIECFAKIHVIRNTEAPIFGYLISDIFGNAIFGENTLSSQFGQARIGEGFYDLVLGFRWPNIARGDYFLTLGVGSGNDALNHQIECWAHNIFCFSCLPTMPIHGLFNNEIIYFDVNKAIGE